LAGIQSTDCLEAKDTLSFVFDEQKANLIHVSRQHDAQPVFAGAPLACSQDIPQGVYLYVVGDRADLFQNDGAHFAFIAGYGAGVAQALQQAKLHRANARRVNCLNLW
jgi:hypothetical protein